jgi:hypothetical protein
MFRMRASRVGALGAGGDLGVLALDLGGFLRCLVLELLPLLRLLELRRGELVHLSGELRRGGRHGRSL